jgi:hypothetical protein
MRQAAVGKTYTTNISYKQVALWLGNPRDESGRALLLQPVWAQWPEACARD